MPDFMDDNPLLAPPIPFHAAPTTTTTEVSQPTPSLSIWADTPLPLSRCVSLFDTAALTLTIYTITVTQVEKAPETAIENYDKRSVRLLTLSLYSTTLIFVALIALTVIITNDYAREAIWFGFAWPITLQSLVLIVKWERTRSKTRCLSPPQGHPETVTYTNSSHSLHVS